MSLVKHSQRTSRKGCRTCGSKDVYYAHDTSRPGPACADCGVAGAWCLINRDGSLHSHRAEGTQTAPEPAAEPSAEPTAEQAHAAGEDAAVALTDALRRLMPAPALDEDKVRGIVAEAIAEHGLPVRTVVLREQERREVEGTTHAVFPDVLAVLSAGLHAFLVGPAGTGKTTIAEQCAESLGLDYAAKSLSPATMESALLGYMDANGEYVPTAFRRLYEHGGVMILDEIDNANPAILGVLNSALANGSAAFADAGAVGMVKRHPDFLVVATANTYGTGPDRTYVGRSQLDGATLDRFEMIDVPVDETLERNVCLSTGLDAARVDTVLARVRHVRRAIESARLNIVCSPRASISACKLLAGGMPWAKVEQLRLRRGMSDEQWTRVADGAPAVA